LYKNYRFDMGLVSVLSRSIVKIQEALDMDHTNIESIEAVSTTSNMKDYEQERANFSWEQIEQQFTWSTTGKVNAAYEAIDRHTESSRKDKIALHYSDDKREESYTYQQMKEQSNRFGNVLRKLGITKGERVFIFMPRTPELYFALLGSIKVGAVVGPLFEAFMETAVRDRLQDSGAIAIVTTPQLVSRIPVAELPDLKHIIIVGDNLELSEGQVDFRKEMAQATDQLDIEWVDREDGLLIHYT
jgi:acetyl-CoA synthetase